MLVNEAGYRKLSRLQGFGATSPTTGADCPVGGDWGSWCNCMFKGDNALIAKCTAQPLGPFSFAPWTTVGATVRGIPKPGDFIVGALSPGGGGSSGGGASGAGTAAGSDGIFGIPTTVAVIGGGVFAAGLGLLLWKKHKRSTAATAGWRRRKGRRANRRRSR